MFPSRRFHLVRKIIISNVIYSTGLGIHNRRKSKFNKENVSFYNMSNAYKYINKLGTTTLKKDGLN